MSKVLVDREPLEKWADKLEGADSAGYGWEDLLAAEIRGAFAQPAEAEGVERWSELRALAESAPGENWKAGNAYGNPLTSRSGKTTLIAACRAIVAAKLGGTVQIPDDIA